MATKQEGGCRLSKENLPGVLAVFMEEGEYCVTDVAQGIGCSRATVERIVMGMSTPTEEFLKRSLIMIEIGCEECKKLSESKKKKIASTIGVAGGCAGSAFAIGATGGLVSAAGITSGLSGAGIMAGLKGVGFGASAATGLGVVAAFPVVAGVGLGALGYFCTKKIINKVNLEKKEKDPRWEE